MGWDAVVLYPQLDLRAMHFRIIFPLKGNLQRNRKSSEKQCKSDVQRKSSAWRKEQSAFVRNVFLTVGKPSLKTEVVQVKTT